jgi:transcriptional antiterminator NusG
MDTDEIYCLFCRVGYEQSVEAWLKKRDIRVISSLCERIVFRNGKKTREIRPILSGYVFFTGTSDVDWRNLRDNPNIIRPLEYADHSRSLRGYDLTFVLWLKSKKEAVGISKAVHIGGKIKIIEGPLKELEGKIIKVNKRQRCVQIEINTEAIINRIWLSYEEIEGIA